MCQEVRVLWEIKMSIGEKENSRNTNGNHLKSEIDLKSNLIFENQIAPEYVTTRLAANLLGISENALRIKVCRGEIPVYKLGRSLRFRITEINQLFQREEY